MYSLCTFSATALPTATTSTLLRQMATSAPGPSAVVPVKRYWRGVYQTLRSYCCLIVAEKLSVVVLGQE